METISQALLSPPLLSSSDIKRSCLGCVCSWGPGLLPCGTLLSSEPSYPWGNSSRAHQLAPAVDLNVPSHTRWQPFPFGTVSDDYTQGQFSGAMDSG